MVVETENVTVDSVPVKALAFLMPHAREAGHVTGKSATMRWAAVELARRIRYEEEERAKKD